MKKKGFIKSYNDLSRRALLEVSVPRDKKYLKENNVQMLIKIMKIVLIINLILTIIPLILFFISGQTFYGLLSIPSIIVTLFLLFGLKKPYNFIFYLIAFAGFSTLTSSLQYIIKAASQINLYFYIYYAIISLFLLIASSYILFKINVSKNTKFLERLKNHDNKVSNLKKAFFVYSIAYVLIIIYVTFFTPIAILDSTKFNILNLFLYRFSFMPILLWLTAIYSIYTIIKKYFFRNFLSILLLAIFTVLVNFSYQDLIFTFEVGKQPIGLFLFLFMAICSTAVLVLGSLSLWSLMISKTPNIKTTNKK